MMLPGMYVVLSSLSLAVADDPQWQRYTPPDARFEVTMPSKPNVTVKYVETSKDVLPVYTASVNSGARGDFPFNEPSEDFLVSWTDYSKATKHPQPTSKTFNAMRDAIADSKNAKVICDHAVNLRGHTGRSVTLRMEDGQIADIVFYVTPSRVYQVMAQTRVGDQYDADRARFLQSFKITTDAG